MMYVISQQHSNGNQVFLLDGVWFRHIIISLHQQNSINSDNEEHYKTFDIPETWVSQMIILHSLKSRKNYIILQIHLISLEYIFF